MEKEIVALKKQVKMLWGFVIVLVVILFYFLGVFYNDHTLLQNEVRVVDWCADYLINDGNSNYKQPVQASYGSGSSFEDAEQNIHYYVE